VSAAVDTSADDCYRYATGELPNEPWCSISRQGMPYAFYSCGERFVLALTRRSARDSLVGGWEMTASGERLRTSPGARSRASQIYRERRTATALDNVFESVPDTG